MTQQSLITRLKAVEEALVLCYDHCRLYHREAEANNIGISTKAALSDLRELIKEAEGQKSAAFQWGNSVVPKTQLKHGEELYTALGEKPAAEQQLAKEKK